MSEDSSVSLPPLSEESIRRIEQAVFDEVAEERPVASTPTRQAAMMLRRRRWVTGLGVAAAFVCGILIAPPLISALNPPAVSQTAFGARDSSGAGTVPQPAAEGMDVAERDSSMTAGGAVPMVDTTAGRDIITNAQMTLRVKDVRATSEAITALAKGEGGYVEGSDLGTGAQPDQANSGAEEGIDPAPVPDGEGWITVRVPATTLTTVMAGIGEHGTVLRSSISRTDVTTATTDLRARVDAADASVKRLTELMAKSGSVGDLIAAESALSERQAQLEAYQQELKNLDESVALSSVQVQLTKRATATTADPAGFGDGLLAGWNGLIVSLNALVVALGFLLPWLAIVAIGLVVFWLVRRAKKNPKNP